MAVLLVLFSTTEIGSPQWVSEYCLTPVQQFVSYIMAKTS